MNRFVAVTIAGFISVLCIPGYAHHSMTMFDTNKEVTLTGVVKEFQYTNPHSWLIIEASNEDGTTTDTDTFDVMNFSEVAPDTVNTEMNFM